ncbi:hypothetical protein P4O66_020304, partial [Electrophorus voltai]
MEQKATQKVWASIGSGDSVCVAVLQATQPSPWRQRLGVLCVTAVDGHWQDSLAVDTNADAPASRAGKEYTFKALVEWQRSNVDTPQDLALKSRQARVRLHADSRHPTQLSAGWDCSPHLGDMSRDVREL